MMKRLLINILMVTFGSLAALGQSTHHEFKVGDFSRLSLIDDINVNYRCNADSAGLVVAEASQQLLDHILFTVSMDICPHSRSTRRGLTRPRTRATASCG